MTVDVPGTPVVFRFVVRPIHPKNPRSAGYLADAHALGLESVDQIACQDLIFIEGCLSQSDVAQLGTQLLSDPLTQIYECQRLNDLHTTSSPPLETGPFLVEVALHPGVTDPVADQIVRAAHILGIQGVARASTGMRFEVYGIRLDEGQVRLLANRLLANPTIQRYVLGEILTGLSSSRRSIGKSRSDPHSRTEPENAHPVCRSIAGPRWISRRCLRSSVITGPKIAI